MLSQESLQKEQRGGMKKCTVSWFFMSTFDVWLWHLGLNTTEHCYDPFIYNKQLAGSHSIVWLPRVYLRQRKSCGKSQQFKPCNLEPAFSHSEHWRAALLKLDLYRILVLFAFSFGIYHSFSFPSSPSPPPKREQFHGTTLMWVEKAGSASSQVWSPHGAMELSGRNLVLEPICIWGPDPRPIKINGNLFMAMLSRFWTASFQVSCHLSLRCKAPGLILSEEQNSSNLFGCRSCGCDFFNSVFLCWHVFPSSSSPFCKVCVWLSHCCSSCPLDCAFISING